MYIHAGIVFVLMVGCYVWGYFKGSKEEAVYIDKELRRQGIDTDKLTQELNLYRETIK